MNTGELRTLFVDTLNRDDCSNDLADQFLGFGLRRVERVLRSPFQRHLLEITIPEPTETPAPGEFTFDGYIAVPIDYLAMDWIKVNGISVNRFSTGRSSQLDKNGLRVDGNRFYYTENEKLYFRPELTPGDVVQINYYRELAEGSFDTDIVESTLIIPDLVMYSALVFAGVHFLDERLTTFKTMYQELLSEVQLMADLDETSGGVSIVNNFAGL